MRNVASTAFHKSAGRLDHKGNAVKDEIRPGALRQSIIRVALLECTATLLSCVQFSFSAIHKFYSRTSANFNSRLLT